MKILHFLRSEFKRTKLPKISMKDSQLKEELKLIKSKSSILPSRARKAVEVECEKRGITV